MISRSVTSCAGMTAYMGGGCPDSSWLSQWRKRTEIPGPPHGGNSYANGRGLCETDGGPYTSPQCLHHFWAFGHERVNGRSNSHGKSYVWNWALLARPELTDCPSDEEFIDSLCSAEAAYKPHPPVALAENVSDAILKCYKIRQLHLSIVDLWRPWKISQEQVRSLTSFMRHLGASDLTRSTTPMMPYGPNAPLHCRRFVCGYSLDGSDFPCYFLWPHRTQQGNFWLLESQTRRYIDISLANFLRPLGQRLQHFYDAFGLKAELSIRAAAMEVFHLQEGDLSNDLLVSSEAAVARGWTDHFEQPIDQNAPEADLRNVPIDVMCQC